MNETAFTLEVGGRPLTAELGRLAKQAGASTLVRYGDTVCLVTATGSDKPREGVDFFPLRVDFEERLYAAGRIPGSFFRREGRPTEGAILSARLIDRPLRPLFPDGFRNDVQVVVTVLSYDDDNLPEIMGITGASLALCLSPIPFDGPVAAVMVGRVDGEFIINPGQEEREASDMEVVIAGSSDAILMVEALADEVPESEILDAIYFGHEAIKEQCRWQEEIIAQHGKEKMVPPLYSVPEEITAAVEAAAGDAMVQAARNADKATRETAVAELKESVVEQLLEQFPEEEAHIKTALNDLERDVIRRGIVEEGLRPDGRSPDEIRPIWSQVGLLPRAHGSGLFTRGQTQVLTVASLGTKGDQQMLDSLGHIEEFKRYMHHYNFPPYSVGETRPLRGPGRREIGHGALAERALWSVLPEEEEFPYTIRLVSEVLESNGSSSMASVCGSSLALMDAGVPIKSHVGGVAMGLVKEGDHVVILSDIQGVEDFLGDMDFKVAGTDTGVTAIQLDTKIAGLPREIMEQAMEQAREGRLHIIGEMSKVLAEPRPEMSPHAPRMIILQINPDRIRDIIGPGGKIINKIQSECAVKIDIEDDGTVFIGAETMEGGEKAQKWIEDLTREVIVGETHLGEVTRLMNFGAFVEIFPGKEGLVHISKLTNGHVPSVEDFVAVGDRIMVKVSEIDDMGRVNLSRIDVVNEDPEAREKESLSGPKVAELDVEPGEAPPPGRGGGGPGGGRPRGRFGGGGDRGPRGRRSGPSGPGRGGGGRGRFQRRGGPRRDDRD